MELDEKLNEILSDPAAMENLKQVASSIFGNENGSSQGKSDESNRLSANSANQASLLDNIDPTVLFSVMKAFNSSEGDDRSRLLLALKPYLSESRRERVDSAIKILKIIKILPLLRKEGVLKDLFGI